MTNKDARSKDRLIGKKLGTYELKELLAAGGMARIYKAMDVNLERVVAVKILQQDGPVVDETLTQRFQREAKAIGNLDHPNIIQVFGYGEDDDLYYMAMKYIEGTDLARELARLRRLNEKMEIRRAISILEQVAAALDYGHQRGVIHRDIKPSNILLDAHDHATLTDFGLVLRATDHTLGTAFGTPRYIAPEQAVASEKSVPQSDIYSLAIILYEILTGQTPFQGDTPMEIALSQISDPPPPPTTLDPTMPKEVEREILKSLEKDPTKRHSSASEFIGAVRKAYEAAGWGGGKTTRPAEKALPTSTPPVVPAVPSPKGADLTNPVREPGRGLPLPLIGGGIAVLVVLGIVFALINGGGGGGGGTTPTDAGAGSGGTTGGGGSSSGLDVRLVYDDTVLYIYNASTSTLDVAQLELVRGSDRFSGGDMPRDELPARACYLLTRNARPNGLVQSCSTQHGTFNVSSRPQNTLFWMAESTTTFEVQIGSQVITTCPTLWRGAAAQTCNVSWPSDRVK